MTFRASLIVCSIFAIGLLFFGRAESYIFGRVRTFVENSTGPLYQVVGPPVASARNFVGNAFRVFSVYGENERLRAENAQLKPWQAQALTLEQKVAGYQALLSLPLEPDIAYRTGRIVDDPGGPFVRTLRINLGAENGIAEGQAVVGPNGLVGRIVGQAKTDSRVPSGHRPQQPHPGSDRSQGAGEAECHRARRRRVGRRNRGRSAAAAARRACSSARTTPRPSSTSSTARPARRSSSPSATGVVTSGKDGLLPPDLPVGTVVSVTRDRATIQLATDFERLTYVRVLDYASPFGQVPAGKGPPMLNEAPTPGGLTGTTSPKTETPQPSTPAKPGSKPSTKPAKPAPGKTPPSGATAANEGASAVIASSPNLSPWRVAGAVVPLFSILAAILVMPLPVGLSRFRADDHAQSAAAHDLPCGRFTGPISCRRLRSFCSVFSSTSSSMGPVGSSSIVFLAVYTITLSQRVYWMTLQGSGLIGGFVFVALIGELLAWGTASFSFGRLLSPTPALVEAAASNRCSSGRASLVRSS